MRMAASRQRRELGRGERVVPGVWRLRLPLPWPGVPHVNAFAVSAPGDDGIVLFDTGMATDGGMRQLELALAQAGFAVEDVRLVVCTHSHTDHYGLAGPIVDRAGCELWMHPAWEHVRAMVEDPDATLDRRIEVARQSGVPPAGLELYEKSRRGVDPGIARLVEPDRELVPGVEVETELGSWHVHETPGHAPSHVTLHQPERRMLITGDHLLGRISLFFDYGHSPDPVAEFIGGLDTVEQLDAGLTLAGHGRPFRDPAAKIAANRAELAEQLERVRDALSEGPRTGFEVAGAIIGAENMNTPMAAWGLQLALAYLDHLSIAGEAVEVEGHDPRRWELA
jgi:glyoxylase-like metal-dependent hydrolase (beta-lactamase superfamily II)